MTTTEQKRRFSTWMSEHVAIIHHVVHAFAAGDDRNDLTQEILIGLWRAVPAFRGDCVPTTFIYRVAHNAALLWHRTERRHRRRTAVAGDIDWMMQPEAGRNRSDTPARLEAVYRALQSLVPIDRSLMLLSLDGLGYREIAEIHGLSESNIGARLSRARQRLTEIVNQKEFL